MRVMQPHNSTITKVLPSALPPHDMQHPRPWSILPHLCSYPPSPVPSRGLSAAMGLQGVAEKAEWRYRLFLDRLIVRDGANSTVRPPYGVIGHVRGVWVWVGQGGGPFYSHPLLPRQVWQGRPHARRNSGRTESSIYFLKVV